MISGFCEKGKHGRCSGWMIVPAYSELAPYPDMSVRCWCPVCKHPPVEPDRHITKPPKVKPWSSNS